MSESCSSVGFRIFAFCVMVLCAMAAQGVIDVKDGKFTLVKPDAYSAAFLVTFEL